MRHIICSLIAALAATPLFAEGERFILVADNGAEAVYAVNPFNGTRTEISGPNRGTGHALGDLQGIAARRGDPEMFYVTCTDFDGDPAVVEIEWATGNRREVSGGRGDGVDFEDPRQLVLIDDGDFAVVADNDEDLERLFAVDLDDGDRLSYITSSALFRPRTLAREDDEHILVSYRGDEDDGINARLQRVDIELVPRRVFDLVVFPLTGDFANERGPLGITLDFNDDILVTFDDPPIIWKFELDEPMGSIVDDVVVSAGSNFDGDREGNGPQFESPIDLVFFIGESKEDDEIFLLDSELPGVFSVDPEDGDRTILSSNTVGTGPQFTLPRSIALGRDVPNLTAMDIAEHLTGEDLLTSDEQEDADLDEDGFVTVTDLVMAVNVGL